jgi:hypothetical protein
MSTNSAVGIAAPTYDSWTDDEWAAHLDDSQAAAARDHWARFMRLYGDEADPAPGAPLSDDDLLRALADVEALTTQLMALQSRHLRALRDRRVTEQAAHRSDHSPQECTRGCCDPDGWVTLEVAQTLGVTERQVEHRIDTADRLLRYAAVHDAAVDGLLQAWTATKLLEHLDELAPHVSQARLERIERATVAWLLDRPRTVGQLNARMRRLLIQVRGPDADSNAAARRFVRVTPADACGLATLVARLPEPDAVAIAATVNALACDPVDGDDTRTHEQRGADVLTACVTGLLPAHGRPGDLELIVRSEGSLSVHLDVTIPADRLCGAAGPAEVPGYGAVPAATALTLAGQADGHVTARPLVYDPGTGRLLGAGTGVGGSRVTWLDDLMPGSGYEHPPVLERIAVMRDGTCRAPGCSRRAARCDCDHVVPYPEGPTSIDNTCCLCRRHHRLKTHAPGWSLRMADDGTAVWTTPTGRTLTTDPASYAAELPEDQTPP